MEVVHNEQTGKETVFLNGTAYIRCVGDLDCPGIAHCEAQADYPWIDGPNSSSTMCICPPYLASEGALCDQHTSLTYGLFGVTLLPHLAALLGFVIGSKVLLDAMKTSSFRSSQTFYLTLAPAWFTCLMIFIFSLHWEIRYIDLTNYVIETDLQGVPDRRTALWMMEQSTFVLSFTGFLFSMNNFSLLWFDVLSSAALRGKNERRYKTLRNNYKIFLIIFYIISMVVIVVFLTNDDFLSISIACIPGFVLVCVFYGVAWYKVRGAEQLLTSSDISSSQSIALRRLLHQVQAVALKVFVVTVIMVAFSSMFYLLDSRPGNNYQQCIGMLLFFCGALDELLVVNFLRNVLQQKLRKIASSCTDPADERPIVTAPLEDRPHPTELADGIVAVNNKIDEEDTVGKHSVDNDANAS